MQKFHVLYFATSNEQYWGLAQDLFHLFALNSFINMNNTDFTSIITQVSKPDDQNRSVQLNPPGTSTINNNSMSMMKLLVDHQLSSHLLARSTRRRRFLSFLLCCLNVSKGNRSKSAIYSPSHDSTTNHEVKFLEEITRSMRIYSYSLLH